MHTTTTKGTVQKIRTNLFDCDCVPRLLLTVYNLVINAFINTNKARTCVSATAVHTSSSDIRQTRYRLHISMLLIQ